LKEISFKKNDGTSNWETKWYKLVNDNLLFFDAQDAVNAFLSFDLINCTMCITKLNLNSNLDSTSHELEIEHEVIAGCMLQGDFEEIVNFC